MTAAVFLQVVLRFIGWTGIDGLEEVPRYLFVWLVMLGAAAAMYRGEHTTPRIFHQPAAAATARPRRHWDQCGRHRPLRLPDQVELRAGSKRPAPDQRRAGATAWLRLRRDAGRRRPDRAADAAEHLFRSEEPMAETLLIVFIVFILLGMPISIALGVGALGAAMFYPALNPIIIPTRFVGLLSDSYLLLSRPAVHSRRQHRGPRRRRARDHRPRHRAGRALPRRARLRERRRQHVLRRHLGLGGGRRLRARHVSHPADGAQGLRPRFRDRAHRSAPRSWRRSSRPRSSR